MIMILMNKHGYVGLQNASGSKYSQNCKQKRDRNSKANGSLQNFKTPWFL